MTHTGSDPITNAGSDPDAHARRTGGSADDPHGGRDGPTSTRPDPDPLDELATIDASGAGGPADRPHLARQAGPKPGFGPNPEAERLEGNPDLGIDPRDVKGAWHDGPKAP